MNKNSFFTPQQLARSIDVISLENALVDLLVRVEESDLTQLMLTKGVMQLVQQDQQARILAHLGKLTTEVELGGSAANVVRGLALLGARVSYSSCVGYDDYGKAFLNRLDTLGILNRVALIADLPTGTCVNLVTPDGERTLNTHLGACTSYSPEFVPESDIIRSKVFFTTGYVWDTQNQILSVRRALEVARENETVVALDLADPFAVARSGEEFRKLFSKAWVDIVFANAQEARMMVGVEGEAAARILSEQVRIAVVKAGVEGAYIGCDSKVTFVPSIPVKAIDTTGAGDMFAGGFLYGLTNNFSLEHCGKIGTLLASDTIQHMGVRLSNKILEQVRQLLNDINH